MYMEWLVRMLRLERSGSSVCLYNEGRDAAREIPSITICIVSYVGNSKDIVNTIINIQARCSVLARQVKYTLA